MVIVLCFKIWKSNVETNYRVSNGTEELSIKKTKVPYSHNYISHKMRHNDHTDDEVPSHSYV